MKRALITGIAGQDGSYLAEHLLAQGYEVHGIDRAVALEESSPLMWRIMHLRKDIRLHAGSLDSLQGVIGKIDEVKPDECYHLAAQSFVGGSFDDEFSTLNTNINGTHFMLAALRGERPECRFFLASSAEMFGKAKEVPQNENTPFHPRSPYGISKVAAFHLARTYREAYGMFAASGILFNHESPRRGFEFVTRKISSHVAKIKLGQAKEVRLGNLDAQRDWGHAADYVPAMWMMLQQPVADDYVIATGETHSVREFCAVAFSHVGLNYEDHVVVDKQFFRPAEVDLMKGDSTKARAVLGWVPRRSFEDLVREMVDTDLELLKK